jgi:hypothetical protein
MGARSDLPAAPWRGSLRVRAPWRPTYVCVAKYTREDASIQMVSRPMNDIYRDQNVSKFKSVALHATDPLSAPP